MTTASALEHPRHGEDGLFALSGTAYRYDWGLFADWCMAIGQSSLPAHPVTLARFLDAHPAAANTNRRRITAVNWVHREAGYLVPGRAQAIRDILQPPSDTADRDLVSLLRGMPTAGWTAGLFGRRDALLLLLAEVAGFPLAAIERMQRADAHVDGHTLRIRVGDDTAELDALPDGDPRECPVAIYLRWARLLSFHDKRPSSRAIADALSKAAPLSADSVEKYQLLPALAVGHEGPLLPAIDQWGHLAPLKGMPGSRRGMSTRAMTVVIESHLSGTAPMRKIRPRTNPAGASLKVAAEDSARGEPFDVISPAPDPSVGIDRRRAATKTLDDLAPVFDEIDARTTELLARTQALLDGLSGDA